MRRHGRRVQDVGLPTWISQDPTQPQLLQMLRYDVEAVPCLVLLRPDGEACTPAAADSAGIF